MKKLTQERLKEVLDYDPETGVFIRKISFSNRVMGGSEAGGTTTHGYKVIVVDGQKYLAHRLAWLYVEGFFPLNIDIDHIDQDPSNNRFFNLRLV